MIDIPEDIKAEYTVEADKVETDITVLERSEDHVPRYFVDYPEFEEATKTVLDDVKEEITRSLDIEEREILDPKSMEKIKNEFLETSKEVVGNFFPKLSEERIEVLAGRLTHEMYGLGRLEILLRDDDLEELVVNSSDEPVWVYHKEFGWLKTDISIGSEGKIYNYSSVIGRRVGKQITNLQPLLDAHLPSGDRVNATLFPISTQGNTITIRKFARNPWTVTHFIDPELGTLSKELAALMWLSIQYEMNMLIAGGTASGKTALLNTLTPFIPPNQRIVTIEDTRELNLPQYLHWVPMTTREANPEGKGEVSMLDLMVNSLRMRPDRIMVGEIREKKQAEVLFEAMLTGHSVYATLHANTAQEVKRRMANPPINIPKTMLESLHLTCVQYRDRRTGIRRTRELAELVPKSKRKGEGVDLNVRTLYRWKPDTDTFEKVRESERLIGEIKDHTSMSEKEIQENLREKEKVLEWFLENDLKTTNSVGKIVAEYYNNKGKVLDLVRDNAGPDKLLTEDVIKEMKKRGLRD
ncbi:MAG: type II/IV secretion system ATPase subunit [Candidatus Aenigmatarchaeota archaeon]